MKLRRSEVQGVFALLYLLPWPDERCLRFTKVTPCRPMTYLRHAKVSDYRHVHVHEFGLKVVIKGYREISTATTHIDLSGSTPSQCPYG